MQTLLVLNDIVARLTAALPDFDVQLFPEEPENFRLNHANGAVLVAYHASDYGKPLATDIAHQLRTLQIRITVVARSQHNDLGALAVLDHIRHSVLGYRPPHCNQIYLDKEQFEGQEKRLWQYGMWLYCQTSAVEYVSPNTAPKFVRGVYDNKTTSSII